MKAVKGEIPELKKNEVINTLRLRDAHQRLDLYTVKELRILFSTLLNTTESELGHYCDKNAKLVARPNFVFTIDPLRVFIPRDYRDDDPFARRRYRL